MFRTHFRYSACRPAFAESERRSPANPNSLPGLLPLALFCLILATSLRAQSVPVISGGTQLVVQRGQTMNVAVKGQHLESVSSIALSQARGLSVDLAVPEKSAKPTPGELRLNISADADAALGERELRVIGPGGVSAPLRVTVAQYPLVLEKEPNNTPDQAQDIEFPVTLAGKIDVMGDVDCFRFTGHRGQKLVFDVHAARSRSALDPQVALYNEAGREMAGQIDLHGGDPTVVFAPPADGRYVLAIRDLQYRGGGDFSYRIDAGEIPYVQSVLPMSAQPGKVTEVKPQGVNLTGAESIPLDLTYAGEGRISVRARASGGVSNAVAVDVNDLPSFVDARPGHKSSAAVAIRFPGEISGLLDAAGDSNWYKFHIPRRQGVTLEGITAAMGSPVQAVIALANARGETIQTVEDNGTGANPVLSRDLEAGDYQVALRDLFYHGGPTSAYRLSIRPRGVIGASAQDFAVRFLPDAVRVSRGGNAPVFVDLQRKADFKGDVTITVEDLPPGVSCPPLVINDKLPGFSGMLVLSAADDAAPGSFPIRLGASAFVGGSLVSHEATPVLDGRPVEQTYLTVLAAAAPLTIDSVATLNPARLAQLSAEAGALAKRIVAANPAADAAQIQWEKKVAPIDWQPLVEATAASADGATLSTLLDDSILASGPAPTRDTYTVQAIVDMPGITAIRLEALTDPSLPIGGPGRAGTGNFVLSHFAATIAPLDDPGNAKPIALQKPVADFSQAGFPVIDAIEPKPGKGWAMNPRGGTPNEAVFFTTAPVGNANGALLTFTLDHQFGQKHTLGRFRISITSDPQAMSKAAVPSRIVDLLQIPAAKRSVANKAAIAAFYRTIDPGISRDAARIEAIREVTAVPAEIARLQAVLVADSPALNAERDRWEKAMIEGSGWLPLDFVSAKSRSGARLAKQPDDSILAIGENPPTDAYTLVAKPTIKNITAIRVEALPDPTLPGNGPGRAPDGNFVLSNISATISPKQGSEPQPVKFSRATATFAQDNFAAENAISDQKEAGWAILPNAGRPAAATFYAAEPIAGDGELTIVLRQQFSSPQHTLGRFRIWVTANPEPAAASTLPPELLAVLKAPADKATQQQQKDDLMAYFRAIAPSLVPVRERLAELQELPEARLAAGRGKKISIPFLLNRAGFAGDATVSLEGFINARDPVTAAPEPLNKLLRSDPVDVPAGKFAGTLSVIMGNGAGAGERYVVLKVEPKGGDETRAEYSAPFILTALQK